MRFNITVRKFYCDNPDCERSVFAELARRYSYLPALGEKSLWLSNRLRDMWPAEDIEPIFTYPALADET